MKAMLLLAFLVAGCEDSDNTPVCRQDVPLACTCYTGGSGTRTCDGSGLGAGPCVCSPDAGVADAATDVASVDTAIDAAP